MGIELVDFRRISAAPEIEMIFKAEKLFKSIKYLTLIHCKSVQTEWHNVRLVCI